MNEIEALRKKNLNILLGGFLIIAVTGAVIYKFGFNAYVFFGGAGVIVSVFGFMVKSVADYKNSFVYNVLKPLLEKESLKYYPDRGIGESEALESGFFNFEYDIYRSYDYIEADGFYIVYLEFKKNERRTDQNGNTVYVERVLFSGYLSKIKTGKKVKSEIFIKPDIIHLSDILPIVFDEHRVKMDSPEFEKIFDVYSNDQIEARRVLNNAFMEKLIEIHKLTGVSEMRFINDLVYLLSRGGSIRNCIPLFKPVDNKTVENILSPVRYFVNVKEILKDSY
jgi:hypothetical protein